MEQAGRLARAASVSAGIDKEESNEDRFIGSGPYSGEIDLNTWNIRTF